MKINTTIPTQSSFPRLCPEFQLLFLLMLPVAYDAIHMMSSQSVYQQLAAVYCASRVEIRRRQSPVRVASRRLAASIQFKPASPFASPFAHLQQPTLAGFHGHQPEARHRRHSREVARPLPPARPEQRARELRVHHPFRRRFERVVRPRRASREQARHPAFFVRSFVRSVGRSSRVAALARAAISRRGSGIGASPRATVHGRSPARATARFARRDRHRSSTIDGDKTDRKNLSRVWFARRAIGSRAIDRAIDRARDRDRRAIDRIDRIDRARSIDRPRPTAATLDARRDG